MRVIEVKSCRECTPYRRFDWDGRPYCRHPDVREKNGGSLDIDKRTKTFPKFCPLEEAKT